MMIFFALLVGLGVLFGTGAVVVDLGYGMAQQTVMQNAADSGALAAAQLMARSVTVDIDDDTVFLLSDNTVYQRAANFANANSVGGLGTSNYALAVQYLDCAKNPSGTNSFSRLSDLNLVVHVAGNDKRMSVSDASALSLGDGSLGEICLVRVYAQESHPPIFASVLTSNDEQEIAQAIARIAPTAPPQDISNIWPITRYDDPLTDEDNPEKCKYDPVNPPDPKYCTFWDRAPANFKNNGNFKGVVDLSKLSVIDKIPAGTQQKFNCGLTECWDTENPGPLDNKTDTDGDGDLDFDEWFHYAWKGHLSILPDESDWRCQAAAVIASCPNSRLETYQGTKEPDKEMQVYMMGRPAKIDPKNGYPEVPAHSEGVDPDCVGTAQECTYVTMAVFFWSYAEENVCEKPGGCTGPTRAFNQGTLYNPANVFKKDARIILSKLRRFRFHYKDIGTSSMTGNFVGFYVPGGDPDDGAPNAIANTAYLYS